MRFVVALWIVAAAVIAVRVSIRPAAEVVLPEPPRATAQDPWLDAAHLAAVRDWACDCVVAECGGPLEPRPSLRHAAAGDIVLVVAEHGRRHREGSFVQDDAGLAGSFRPANAPFAFYEEDRDTIHLSREAMERAILRAGRSSCARADTAALRWIVVREVTHAWDARWFPALLREGFDEGSLRRARRRSWEGHAQFVAGRVADRLGRRAEFDALCSVLYDAPCGRDLAAAERRLGTYDLDDRYPGSSVAAGRLTFEAADAVGGPGLVRTLLEEPPVVGTVTTECVWLHQRARRLPR